jgi:hypothetical protein
VRLALIEELVCAGDDFCVAFCEVPHEMLGYEFYRRFLLFGLLIDELFEYGEFFRWQLCSFVGGTTTERYAYAGVFLSAYVVDAVDAAFRIASGADHQGYEFIELDDCIACGALEIEMERFFTFHDIPEMHAVTTRRQRRFAMKGKACGYLAAMKTLFHYDHTVGDIYQLPRMFALCFAHISTNFSKKGCASPTRIPLIL